MKEAAKINAEQDKITVGVTFFADLTEEEKMMYHGANSTVVGKLSSCQSPNPKRWATFN